MAQRFHRGCNVLEEQSLSLQLKHILGYSLTLNNSGVEQHFANFR